MTATGLRLLVACVVFSTASLPTAILAADTTTYSASDFARVEKIDTHVHLHGSMPVSMARAKADGFRLLTINVNYSDFPPPPQQLAARDRWLDRYPDLRFVGLHLASLEWDVDRIAAFLRQYPHASVDLAARLVHLKLQASKDREKVRRFFSDFQDRILYATDLTKSLDQADAVFADEAHAMWMDDWQFLSGAAPLKSTEFDGAFAGLALPREVIDKIYSKNARRMFSKAW